MKKYTNKLVVAFIISTIIAFIFCLFYSVKQTVYSLTKSFLNDTPIIKTSDNIKYCNYKTINNKFIVEEQNCFLVIDNIDCYVDKLEIKLKNETKKENNIKVYIEREDANRNVLSFLQIKSNKCYYDFSVLQNVKNIFVVIGEEVGDSFILENIKLNDYHYYLNELINYDYISKIISVNFLIRFLIIFITIFFISFHFVFDINKLYMFFYKYRYCIGLFIILFTILFELNNSSIGMWCLCNNDKQYLDDVIFGKPRSIRTDEYCVYTPMTLSQEPNFQYFGKTLRGTKTDMFVVYGQPIKNIVCIFRPFLLGFLFLGSAKGLSFFWIVRLVLLFLITFEFLLLITNKNKKLSLIGTLLITFAPTVQWWWTPSGIVEIIIYGEALILLLSNCLTQKIFIKRIATLLLSMILSCSYFLVLYPAWQVPFAYVFFVIGIWIIIENHKNYKFDKKDIIPISIFVILFIGLMLYIYSMSKETIDIIMHTAYPGARCETGGGRCIESIKVSYNSLLCLFRYLGNVLMPISAKTLHFNFCAFSVFIDFFPIGLIISFIVLFKDKIKDKLLIMLLILDFFFMIWCFIGFPKFLAQITLLKVSPVYRTFVVLGFINLLILIRSLALVKYNISKAYAMVISFIITIFIIASNVIVYQQYYNLVQILIPSLLFCVIFYLLLRNEINKILILVIVIVMFISGVLVNPIQKGIDVINKSELSQNIKKINTEENGLWVVDKLDFNFGNYTIMQGAATLNSINTYPNLELWEKLDKDKKFVNVYNRYANIIVNLVDREIENKFELVNSDLFLVNINLEEIELLNIKYILTSRDLSMFNRDNIKFKLLYNDDKQSIRIYKIIRGIK